MSQVIIRASLMTALSSYAASCTPPLSIARENTAYNKPADGTTFLEAFLLPANTTVPTVAADRRRFMGTFQVNIWTREGTGAGPSEAIAEALCQVFTVFPKNQMPVSIEAPGSVKNTFTDISGYFVTPVMFQYRFESPN